jgi:hypothetical protein
MAKPIDRISEISCPNLYSTCGGGKPTTYHCHLFPKSETEPEEACTIVDAKVCVLMINPDYSTKMSKG